MSIIIIISKYSAYHLFLIKLSVILPSISYCRGDNLFIFFADGTQTVKMQFDTTFQKIQNRCNLHPMQRLIIAAARYLCYFFNTELSIFLFHKFIGNSKNIGSDLLTLLLYCTVIQRIGKSCFYSRIKFVNVTVSCSGG